MAQSPLTKGKLSAKQTRVMHNVHFIVSIIYFTASLSCGDDCPRERRFLGDGFCDLEFNNPENRFDSGDCCLPELICFRYVIPVEEVDCPEDPCVKSNLYCTPNELGDGICQDHNNGPLCDFDYGDCCLSNRFELGECWPCYCKGHEYTDYIVG